MRTVLTGLAVFAIASISVAEVVTEEVSYPAGDTECKGYIAYDDSIDRPRPGVIVVHEWWGHNEYARKRARMLAELGYIGFAVDMYGEGKSTEHPDEASVFSGMVRKNAELGRTRFQAAMDVLKKREDVTTIAAIGYCFGGGVVLEMARIGLDLEAVVSFHGSLPGEAPPGEVKARILVCHGEEDSFTTPEQIAAFKQAMDAGDVAYSIVTYPGAKHSWTNPEADRYAKELGIPVGYHAEADAKSWKDMTAFLQDSLRK